MLSKIFDKLFGPSPDSIFGKLNWQEWATALVLAVIFAALGGKATDLINFFVQNPIIASSSWSGLITLILALIFKKNQGWIDPDGKQPQQRQLNNQTGEEKKDSEK